MGSRNDRQLVGALDIGGTHVVGALIDPTDFRLVSAYQELPLNSSGHADEILDTIAACERQLGGYLSGLCGVALPGPFDYERGVGSFDGVGKFDALRGLDLGGALRERLTNARDIWFVNDAEAFGLGEWTTGAARNHHRVIAVTVGTGIGSVFLAGGQPVRSGHQVPPHGQLHLTTVGGQPLEDVVSRRAILRRYAGAVGAPEPGQGIDVAQIAVRARRGDAVATDAIQAPLTALGTVLGHWARRFDANAVIVGGAIARAWDLVQPALQSGASADTHADANLVIARAAHTRTSALVGAALHAHRRATAGPAALPAAAGGLFRPATTVERRP